MNSGSEAVDPGRIVLGSRSPQRRDLLSLLVPESQVEILPPVQESEADFAGLSTRDEIQARLGDIARAKNDDVLAQLRSCPTAPVLTADTIILVEDRQGRPLVLGKPDGPDWKATVRGWFQEYYLDRSHVAVTALCLTDRTRRLEKQVVSSVRFHPSSPEMVEWYIGTGEPLGKAGGYGLQGAAGVFVAAVEGSVSNVVGLPLAETWELLKECKILGLDQSSVGSRSSTINSKDAARGVPPPSGLRGKRTD